MHRTHEIAKDGVIREVATGRTLDRQRTRVDFAARMPSKLIAVLWVLGLSSSWSVAESSRETLEHVLTKRFGMKTGQVAAIKRGEPVAVLLPGSVDREIVVAGAVRIQAPAERTVALVRDIERLEKGPSFRHTRRISEPPRPEDFAAFVVSDEDIDAIRACRPGDCDVNLGPRGFEALASINWAAPGAAEHVRGLARHTAFQYLEAYRTGGNQALAVYTDRARPLFVAQEFADMVKRTSHLPDALPELSAYLLGHPVTATPAGTEDFYYWSEADFGLKPVFRINYVVIHRPSAAGLTRYAIATKQLYANHYFHSALEVRILVDDELQPGRSHYLLVLNMARSDGLSGLFGGVVKSRVRSASRGGLQRSLLATKRLAEQASAR